MEISPEIISAAREIQAAMLSLPGGVKRMKLKTLLDRFGYMKRSDANTAAITTALADLRVSLNPPIVRFGESWSGRKF